MNSTPLPSFSPATCRSAGCCHCCKNWTAARGRNSQATLHRTDLQIGTALRAVPELQVFHFHRLPGFKGGFLFRLTCTLQIVSGHFHLSARIYSSSCVYLSRLTNTGICSPLFGSLISAMPPKLPVPCKLPCSCLVNSCSWNGRCNSFSSCCTPCSLGTTVPSFA